MVYVDMRRILSNPNYYFSLARAALRGTFYIIYFSLFRRNIKIGFPFFVSAKVTIEGPGRVVIGPGCLVLENVFRGLSIVTTSKSSYVRIGNKCMLAGLTIRCNSSVTIGNNVMTAISLIQDAYFFNKNKSVNYKNAFMHNSKPILIRDNVWLGGHSTVLYGCDIGAHCVVSAYTVCSNEKINEFSLVTGNPVRKPLPIEQLLKLRNLA